MTFRPQTTRTVYTTMREMNEGVNAAIRDIVAAMRRSPDTDEYSADCPAYLRHLPHTDAEHFQAIERAIG